MSRAAPGSDSTTRFSNRVQDYIRYRPGYPPALLDCLRGEFGLRPEHTIADIGSGTGISAELFLQHGNPVIGIEPNDEMRAAAERLLAGYPKFRSVAGTAEATGLPAASVDWLIAGQAFHWFDVSKARAEALRILRPGGRAALFWNNRLEHTPFLQEYEALLRTLGTDYCAVKHQNTESDGRLEQFFAADRCERRAFPNRQDFDRAGLLGRAFSSSYVPPPGDPRHAHVAARLGDLFDRHAVGGRVAFEYETSLYVGRV